jgi:hypothetical protein
MSSNQNVGGQRSEKRTHDDFLGDDHHEGDAGVQNKRPNLASFIPPALAVEPADASAAAPAPTTAAQGEAIDLTHSADEFDPSDDGEPWITPEARQAHIEKIMKVVARFVTFFELLPDNDHRVRQLSDAEQRQERTAMYSMLVREINNKYLQYGVDFTMPEYDGKVTEETFSDQLNAEYFVAYERAKKLNSEAREEQHWAEAKRKAPRSAFLIWLRVSIIVFQQLWLVVKGVGDRPVMIDGMSDEQQAVVKEMLRASLELELTGQWGDELGVDGDQFLLLLALQVVSYPEVAQQGRDSKWREFGAAKDKAMEVKKEIEKAVGSTRTVRPSAELGRLFVNILDRFIQAAAGAEERELEYQLELATQVQQEL